MPENKNLKPVKLPMVQRWNESPETTFKNNLMSINVELIDRPSIEDLLNYIPLFVYATWAESHKQHYTYKERVKALYDVLHLKTLPTAAETIGLTFRISGISLQEVTHILRYRNASFSVECSGDKWWSHKDALVPTAIQNSDDFCDSFYDRYKQIVRDAKQLYCDMINSKAISIMDARYILPRCLETFYYMRMNYKDAIAFIKQRMDRQIQPQTDNIIAYQMYIQILQSFPIASGVVDINEQNKFYIDNVSTGKGTNLYFPEEHNDVFEYNPQDFIYQKKREELNGTGLIGSLTNTFEELFDEYEDQIRKLDKFNKDTYLMEAIECL